MILKNIKIKKRRWPLLWISDIFASRLPLQCRTGTQHCAAAFSYSILFFFCSVARTVSFEFLWALALPFLGYNTEGWEWGYIAAKLPNGPESTGPSRPEMLANAPSRRGNSQQYDFFCVCIFALFLKNKG